MRRVAYRVAMKTQSLLESMKPQQAVDWMIDHHGTWRVLRAVWVAVLWRKPAARPVAPYDLPDAIRRDIGLPVLPPRADWHPPDGPPRF